MPRKSKPLTHERASKLVQILNQIAGQTARQPVSKKDMAEAMSCKTSELTDEYRILLKRQWADRRTGPDPRGVYLKISKQGRAALKAWGVLYS